jgi:cell wall-associated NlpC family hydrolase
MSNVLGLIKQLAPKYGLDWRAVAAIAHHESGLRSGAVGDNGTSFGPFQLHMGGALPSQHYGNARQWAGSRQGINYALQRMAASGAKGLTGQAAVHAISANFERPADVHGEVADAMNWYGQGHGNIASVRGGSMGPQMAQGGHADLVAQIMARNTSFALTGKVDDPAYMLSAAQNGLTNSDQAKMGNIRPPAGGALPGKVGGAINFAKSLLGTPYVWGGTSSKGVDCSGLVQLAYAKMGIHLPRTTYDQIKVGQKVGWNNLKPGDLVFSDFEGTGKPTHVVMYIGNGKVIAAPHTGTNVQIESLSLFKNNFIGARRVVH